MHKQAIGAKKLLFCAMILLVSVCGCGEKATGPTAVSVKATPPASLPPAALQRRMAEEKGRAADAKYAASSAGARYRK